MRRGRIQFAICVGVALAVEAIGSPRSSAAREPRSFKAEFDETQPTCEQFFLPNSMARPTGFDLERHLREVEGALQKRAELFRSAEGMKYLEAERSHESDNVRKACSGKLLDILAPR